MNFDDDDDLKSGSMEIMAPVMSIQGAAMMDRAAIDQQIATARAFPRSVKAAQRTLLSLATLDLETAEECQYALTRSGKPIIGPSIRFAEIAQVAWGNMRSVSRIIDEGKEFITANAVCHDLETNVATSVDVIRRITDSRGRRYNSDMIQVTGMAGVSIALRNAILRVIPKPFWRPGFAEAQRVIVGDVKTLVERRQSAMKWLAAYGVDEARILAKLNRPSVQDIDVEDLLILRALGNTIKEGEVTPEVAFPNAGQDDGVERTSVKGFNPLAAENGDEGSNEPSGSDRGDAAGNPAPAGQRNAPKRADANRADTTAPGGSRAQAGDRDTRGAGAAPQAGAPDVGGDQGAQQGSAERPKTERKQRQTSKPANTQAEPPQDVLKVFQAAIDKAVENVSLEELRNVSGEFLPLLQKLSKEDYKTADDAFNAAWSRIEQAIAYRNATEGGPGEAPDGAGESTAEHDSEPAGDYAQISQGDDVDRQPVEEAGPADDKAEKLALVADARPERMDAKDAEVWDEVAYALLSQKDEAGINNQWDLHKGAMDTLKHEVATSLRVVRFQARKRLSA